MKRFLASALLIGVSTFGLVGCEQETTATKTNEVKTPTGTVKETETTKVEKTGDAKDKETAPPSTEAPK